VTNGKISTKVSVLRDMMRREDWHGALRLAAKFPRLGREKAAIMKAWESIARPEFQRSIGRDPALQIADGIAALNRRYGDVT